MSVPLENISLQTKEDTATVEDNSSHPEVEPEGQPKNPDSQDRSDTQNETQLDPIQIERENNPALAEFMTACQQGNLAVVEEFISSKKVAASDTFSDNITGLHWACINNKISVVKYLTSNGISECDPNHIGGDLEATPLHWAARNGLVYIVDYLLSNTTADPSLRDSQSCNALHLAVHSSNIMLVIYLLLYFSKTGAVHVDEVDSANRTSLHWAAYQGDLLTVNALLRFGADVKKTDDSLFIPLHWAFMKGYKTVLRVLLDAGSDIFTKNDQNKTSFDVAKDMNCESTWTKVLKELGRSESKNWEPKTHFLKEKHAKLLTFLTPYVILPCVFYICSFSEGFAIPKIFASVVLFFVSVSFLQTFILPIYIKEDKPLFKSPFLAGIFSGTGFWTISVWFFKLLPALFFKRFFSNVLLAGIITIFAWSFFKAMFINPGFVPTPSDNSVIFEQVKELIKIGKFDTDNFCINSYVRKPLRSRYSRQNKRLVARFDHYCPWVYNELGVRNHKLFMAFIYSLAAAIVVFTSLSITYFHKIEDSDGYDSDDESLQCALLLEELCVGYRTRHFHFNIMMFCLFQFVWLGFLCIVQTFQICKGLTTWEFSLLNSRMTNPSPNHSTLPRDFNGNLQPSIIPPQHQRHTAGFGTLARLLGLDQFFLTVKLTVLSLFNKASPDSHYSSLDNLDIPTDYGIRQNWNDFWFLGDVEWRNIFLLPIEGENNLNGQMVDYYKLYEYPPKHTGSDAV